MHIGSRIKAVATGPSARNLATRLAPALVALAITATAQSPATWRYNVHPGDHLVYSYFFHREIRTDEAQTTVEAKFHSHVLIVGEHNGVLSAGFQRNRDNASLLAYHVKGKDKLGTERPKFERRMQARPTQFSEAMEFTATGEPRYSWETARESPSHLLPDLHEIELLPQGPVKVGAHHKTQSGFQNATDCPIPITRSTI